MKRNELLANVPDRSIWPTVNSNLIDPANKELFERRYKAINLYLDGESQTIIQSITGIHRTQLSKLLEKCLLSHSDGKIQGYRALLPYKRIESYKRNAKLQVKYPEQQGGCSGLLLETFNKYPKIKKVIDQLIEKKNSPDINVHEKSIRAVDLHQAFLKLLKKAAYYCEICQSFLFKTATSY